MIETAAHIALRSTMRTHRTGAVIVRDSVVISNGWSHTPHYRLSNGQRSIHAEIHALARGRHKNLDGSEIFIATVSGKSGNLTNAMPCLDCAIALRSAGVYAVHYTFYRNVKKLWLPAESHFEDLKVYRNGDR